MSKNFDKLYGFFGWKELLNSRNKLLSEFDAAKGDSVSQPVMTHHGVAGEAIIRDWLSTFLPKKFGVTSGFIIPDILTDDYEIKHFDIIIYDYMNSPVLWVQSTRDNSEQGIKKAIPATYVYGVIECKASLNNETANQSITKLSELNDISNYLPNTFSCWNVFFDFDKKLINNKKILISLLPENEVYGYKGGIILRCQINSLMTGLLRLSKLDKPSTIDEKIILPLVKNIDDIGIGFDSNGQLKLTEQGAGVMLLDGPDKKWHVSRQYCTFYNKDQKSISLDWSYNNFARFSIELLLALEGRSLRDGKYLYGQVFEKIQFNTEI